jgi:hypothetical protein
MRFSQGWFVAAMLVFVGVAHGVSPAPEVDAALQKAWRRIDARPPNQGVRDLFSFALEATAIGWQPERVETALRLGAELQDRDAASKTRGNFRWYRNQPKPVDLNAVQFCLQQATLLWLRHREALTAGARETLLGILREGATGARNQRVDVSYTNIFLMKTWNLVALGEALDDDGLRAEGARMFDEWLAYTRRNGIHEFLSPTYSGIDVDSLALLHRFAPTADLREKAQRGLRLIWLQSAANWFAPARRLGGAHSRDYDYLNGHGAFDGHLANWGWMPARPAPLPAFAELTRWVPTEPLPPLPLPRTVWQRWGDEPGMEATTYVGREFCLGTSGSSYNSDDKVFTIQFPGGDATVMGYFVLDGRGDPYGRRKEPDRNGHAKALHPQSFISAAQRGAEALFVCSFDPQQRILRRAPAITQLLEANLVVPDDVEVWSGEERLPRDSAAGVELAADRPIFLRKAGVVIGLRVLAATDCRGQPVIGRYERDGREWGAARLVWRQSAGPADGEAHVIWQVRGAEGVGPEAFAAWRREFTAAPGSAQVEAGVVSAQSRCADGAELALRADLKSGARKISPASPTEEILTVNGQSLLVQAGLKL